jgi:hypothetical protein
MLELRTEPLVAPGPACALLEHARGPLARRDGVSPPRDPANRPARAGNVGADARAGDEAP